MELIKEMKSEKFIPASSSIELKGFSRPKCEICNERAYTISGISGRTLCDKHCAEEYKARKIELEKENLQ